MVLSIQVRKKGLEVSRFLKDFYFRKVVICCWPKIRRISIFGGLVSKITVILKSSTQTSSFSNLESVSQVSSKVDYSFLWRKYQVLI